MIQQLWQQDGCSTLINSLIASPVIYLQYTEGTCSFAKHLLIGANNEETCVIRHLYQGYKVHNDLFARSPKNPDQATCGPRSSWCFPEQMQLKLSQALKQNLYDASWDQNSLVKICHHSSLAAHSQLSYLPKNRLGLGLCPQVVFFKTSFFPGCYESYWMVWGTAICSCAQGSKLIKDQTCRSGSLILSS